MSQPISSWDKAMRRDWDDRARRDALFYIASGTADSEDSFWDSGRRELDEQVLPSLVLRPDATALEIGCGIGRLARPMAERVGSVIGLDISAEMVRRARELCAGIANIRLEVTDGSLAVVGDSSVDLVYSYIVFQHIPSAEPIARYLHESARCLRPGGIVRFQVDGRPENRRPRKANTYEGARFDRAGVEALLSGTGLFVIEEWGRDTHYYWITARRPGTGARITTRERLVDLAELGRLAEALPGLSAPAELRRAMDVFLMEHRGASARMLVEDAFRVLLRRAPAPEELDYNAGLIERGLEPPESWIDTLLNSVELRARLTPFAPEIESGALGGLVARLAREGGTLAESRSAGAFCSSLLALLLPLDPERAIVLAYRIILDREPDEDGLSYYSTKLARRELSTTAFVLQLLGSAEFEGTR